MSYYNITSTKRKRHLYFCSCHLQQHTGCVKILPTFSQAKTFSPHCTKLILCDTATELFIGQGYTNPGNQVAVGTKFCMVSLNICVLRTLLSVYHPSGACSFEVAPINGKSKIHPRTGHEVPEGGLYITLYSSTLSLTLVLDEGGWSRPRPGRYAPWKETRYPLYRRLCGPQGRSGRVRKISPSPSPVRPARS